MKIADVKTDTVVYAVAEHGGPDRNRAVVLDTARWQTRTTGPRERATIVGYMLAPSYGGQRDAYSNVTGMLAVQVGGRGVMWQADRPEMSDAELLDWAARVAVDIADGTVPVLPEGLKIRFLKPRDIDCTWVDYLARVDAAKLATRQENDVRAQRAAAEEDARLRLVAVLGDRTPRYLPSGMSWTTLEFLCRSYADAVVPTVSV